jgi:hypothetical protein
MRDSCTDAKFSDSFATEETRKSAPVSPAHFADASGHRQERP